MSTYTLKTRFGEVEVSKDAIEGDFTTIPVIDLSDMKSPDLEKRKQVARQIYDASSKVGFFYIKNHGIAEESIEKIHDAAHKYFKLPLETKMESYMGESKNFRGYTPLLGGHQSTDVEEKPSGNLSEAFDIGYELAGDRQAKPTDVLSTDDAGMYGQNIWPREEALPGFKATFLDYYGQILDLGRDMLRIFALALDLPEDHFDNVVKHPGSLSRLMFYPPQAVGMDEHEGISPHTDYECFTILSQDTVPALQVLNKSNQWIVAKPMKNHFVVNIGDFFSFWTNGIFKSTIHRATNLTGEQRYSVPFFFGVDYDATVSVIESCVSEGNPLKYPGPVKAGEYVRKQLSTTYVAPGDKVQDQEVAKMKLNLQAVQA
ncbi:1-aminocyclopropane-1-carboxylate oxidase [Coniochaeta ligniaria NRRL 30616]|uniref:1-aminocyclopropane-1-carboxylate oxidase n=1 Tax=Coniochaeta ligniaria NRRL 30616 TaxID=1408157 RepID=A0A1J7I7T4_9PEZI|nr:1-aminocyclopropane-1-carboxylate oxidase [Coniochaeta ligniaria NRRL 30616]